jgi:hypothetical protein
VSFTEAIPQVPPRRRTTTRLRTGRSGCVGDAARSVVEVADGAGVSWPTAHAAFVAHAESVLGDPAPVTGLGIDETRHGKPRWTRDQDSGRWCRTDPWDTGFVDLAGDQGLLGQVEGLTFDAHGRRGRRPDPEWANRRRLMTARERLSPRAFASMWNALVDNDPSVDRHAIPPGCPSRNSATGGPRV